MYGDSVNDDQLMAEAAQGDERAFQLLVSRWEQAVFGFLYHMVGSSEDAEDLTQETFLRVHGHASKYRPEDKFQSWLFRIAGNLARSYLRRRKLLRWFRFDTDQHDQPDPALLPDEALARKQVRDMVRAALEELPFRQRQAVVLQRYQGLSYREIANLMATTPAAVESLLQRAADRLRRRLAGKVATT